MRMPCFEYFSSKFGRAAFFLSLLGLTGCFSNPRQAVHLAAWSPDGSVAALVKTDDESGDRESGVWLLDASSGELRQIVKFSDGSQCLQPQWSPDGSEILFARLGGEGRSASAERAKSYSVWRTGRDGKGLVKIADSAVDDEELLLVLPNAILWGPERGTVIMNRSGNNETAALYVDSTTGRSKPILPEACEAYVIRTSPSGEKAAALLFGDDEVVVYVADFSRLNWKKLARLKYEDRHLSSLTVEAYWSRDSSRFVLPEEFEEGGGSNEVRHAFRVFDARSGSSRRYLVPESEPPIVWSREGDRLFFSCVGEQGLGAGIYELEIATGRIRFVAGENGALLRILAQDTDHGFLYSYTEVGSKEESGAKFRRVTFYRSAPQDSELTELVKIRTGEEFQYSVSPSGSSVLLFSELPHVVYLDLRGERPPADLLLTPGQMLRAFDASVGERRFEEAGWLLQLIPPSAREDHSGAYHTRKFILERKTEKWDQAEITWIKLMARWRESFDYSEVSEAIATLTEFEQAGALRELYVLGMRHAPSSNDLARAFLGVADTHRMDGNTPAALSQLRYVADTFPRAEAGVEALKRIERIYADRRDFLSAAEVAGILADRTDNALARTQRLMARGRYLAAGGDSSGAARAFHEALRPKLAAPGIHVIAIANRCDRQLNSGFCTASQ